MPCHAMPCHAMPCPKSIMPDLNTENHYFGEYPKLKIQQLRRFENPYLQSCAAWSVSKEELRSQQNAQILTSQISCHGPLSPATRESGPEASGKTEPNLQPMKSLQNLPNENQDRSDGFCKVTLMSPKHVMTHILPYGVICRMLMLLYGGNTTIIKLSRLYLVSPTDILNFHVERSPQHLQPCPNMSWAAESYNGHTSR